MKYRYISNFALTLASALMVAFFFGYGAFYCATQRWVEAVVFAVLGCAFSFELYQSGTVIEVSDQAVDCRFLCFTKLRFDWNEIREMGVVDVNVFSRSKRKKSKTGTRFIYLSPREMTKNSRFDMIVKWPPKDIVYTDYSPEKLQQMQQIWGKPIMAYNVEDLFPTTED